MRILRGIYARRELLMPPSSLTRPTSHKVRGAIFDMLDHRLDWGGGKVLDIFAGSGALGLEALSRGAQEAIFIEKNHKVLTVLKKNIVGLGVHKNVTLLKGDPRTLKTIPHGCGVIFLDPPYEENLLVPTLETLWRQGALSPKAYVVMECSKREHFLWPPFLRPCMEKRHGDTQIFLGSVLDAYTPES